MKTKHYILLAIAGLIAFLSGLFIGKGRTEKPPCTVTETRETMVDTTAFYAPMPQSELASGTHRYTLPVYRFLGGGYGCEPRQRNDNDSISVDTSISGVQGRIYTKRPHRGIRSDVCLGNPLGCVLRRFVVSDGTRYHSRSLNAEKRRILARNLVVYGSVCHPHC